MVGIGSKLNFSTASYCTRHPHPVPTKVAPEQTQQVFELPETSAVTDPKEALAPARNQTRFPPHTTLSVFLGEAVVLCTHPDLCHTTAPSSGPMVKGDHPNSTAPVDFLLLHHPTALYI